MSNYTEEREKPSAIEGTANIEQLNHAKSCMENALSGELQAREQDTAIVSSSSPQSLEHAVSGSSLGGDDCSAHAGGDDWSVHGGSSISRTSLYGPSISATPSTSSLSETDVPDYLLSSYLQEKHVDCVLISHSSSMEGAKRFQEYAQRNVVMPDEKMASLEFMDNMCVYVDDKFEQLTEMLKFTTNVFVVCTKKLFEDKELKANVRATLANWIHDAKFVPVYLCERDKMEVERSQYHIGIKVPIAFYENPPKNPDFLKLLTKRIAVGFEERKKREAKHEKEKREEKNKIQLDRQKEALSESGDDESNMLLTRKMSSISLDSTDDAMFKQPVPSACDQFTNGAENSSTAQSVAHHTLGGASGYNSPGGDEQSPDRCYSGMSYPAMDETALSRIMLEAHDVPVVQRGWAESSCTTSVAYTAPGGQAPCMQQAGSSRDVVPQRVPVSVCAVTDPGPPPTFNTPTMDHMTSATTSGTETLSLSLSLSSTVGLSLSLSLSSTGGPHPPAGVAARAAEDSSQAQPFHRPSDEKNYSLAQPIYKPPDNQQAVFPLINPEITTSAEMAGRQRHLPGVEGSGDTALVAASDGSQQQLAHQPSRPLDASQTNPTGSYPDYEQLRQQPPSGDQPQSLQDQVTLPMEQVRPLSVQDIQGQPLASSAHQPAAPLPAADPVTSHSAGVPVYQNQPLAFPASAQWPPPDRSIESLSSTAEHPEPSAVSQPSQNLASAHISYDEQQVLLRE